MRDEIEKLAQRRRLRDKGFEAANLKRKFHERLSPMFQGHMAKLRGNDDALRKKVQDSNPKGDIDLAKKFYRERNYLDSLSAIQDFLNKLNPIFKDTEELKTIFKEEEFYKIPGNFKSHEKLKDLSDRRNTSGRAKKAGITDVPGDIYGGVKAMFGTEEERNTYVMEKRRKLETRKKKELTRALIKVSDAILKEMKATFDKMGTARAAGNLEAYIKAIAEFEPYYNGLERRIVDMYNGTFKKEYESAKAEEEKDKELKDEVAAEPALSDGNSPEEEVAHVPTEAPANPQTVDMEAAPGFPGTITQVDPDLQPESDPSSPNLTNNPNSLLYEHSEASSTVEIDKVGTVDYYEEFSDLIKSAQELLLEDKGMAAALLLRASQICEDLGGEKQSMQLYAMAEELINE